MNVSRAKNKSGFTITELLICIVIVTVLAVMTIISYGKIREKSINASLQADLNNATKTLQLFAMQYGHYPSTIDCSQAESSTNKCLSKNGDSNYVYRPDVTSGYQGYNLAVASSSYNYSTNQNGMQCPVNFIIVPGNSTYGTSDFCVMKYEAKQVNSTTPISQASGSPWVNISLANANTYSANVAGCTNCHLMTEAEFMTLAQDVASVPSNWSSGVVGTGYMYRGHTDNSPSNPIEASTDDGDGYYLTGNSAASGKDQRRTLTLTNGEVIWDLAGNSYDLTSITAESGQQPGLIGESAYATKEWNTLTDPGELTINPDPAWGNPAASSWTTSNGIGLIYSNAGFTGTRMMIRGGWWGGMTNAGLFHLNLGYSTTGNQYTSFRVTK